MDAINREGFSERDGANISIWQTTGAMRLTITDVNDNYDVAIVGGGITGVTAGLLLQQAGRNCVIVEAHNIGYGTTGGTSAHINTFADTGFKDVESDFGEKGAKLFAQAIREGFGLIRENIRRYDIDCDFEEKIGYVYAEDEKQVKELLDIYQGAVKVGVEVRKAVDVPCPVIYKEAIAFPGQAQFHPLKYLNSISAEYMKLGGNIMENAIVADVVKEGDIHIVRSAKGEIRAKNVIYATHMPPGINVFSFRCAPYRSYVLGVKLGDNAYPQGLVYDMQDPYHYFRTHEIEGESFLIAGGNDHKTGHSNAEQSFADLEEYVRKVYNVKDVVYKWSSQYYSPADGLPYIGQMPMKEGVYCATGYNGNGMMLGTIAAKILADTICGKADRFGDLFTASRLKPAAGFKEFIKENADVVYQFVAARLAAGDVESVGIIKNNEGAIVDIDGNKLAVYRDGNGQLHVLDAVCTHAGCIVSWNSSEKSWDCPCHGARYSVDGIVLTGPATKKLTKIPF